MIDNPEFPDLAPDEHADLDRDPIIPEEQEAQPADSPSPEYTEGPTLTYTKTDPDTQAEIEELIGDLPFTEPEMWAALAKRPRMTGQELAAELRQARREIRLAEKGY